jgi:hypothetical protein
MLGQPVPIKRPSERWRLESAVPARQREQIVLGKVIFLAIAVACSSCGAKQSEEANRETPPAANLPAEAPAPSPETIRPGEPGGLPDDRTPIAEGPIDPKSAQGAGQILQRFGGLLERRQFAEAYRLWSDGGRASGLTEAQFVAAHDKYSEIHSEVGAPGQMEGAAGSSYIDIPFRLYGKFKAGGPFNIVGTVTMRRVNDVPGSTEEQRRWHIYKSELAALP